jgi:hypothetical protein
MSKLATKADLAATIADLRAMTAALEASIEALRLRLTVRIGGLLITGFIGTGLVISAPRPFPVP